jgi:hypothetical protein
VANPFDQFDAPAAQPAKVNPFDQFDAKPSVAADIVTHALPTGAVKAAASVPGFPGDMQDMGNQLVDKIMLGAMHKGMDWSGYGPQAGTPERDRFDNLWRTIGSDSHLPTGADIQHGVEKVTGPLPEAQTVPGKFTEAVIANAPAAAMGGGGALARTANVVVPAVASEAAGEMSAGTKFEPLMRFLGGLFGNGARGAVASQQGAPERMVREATRGMTPTEFNAAAELQEQAAATGIPLSGPEAVQATTSGGTRLGDIQRVVENSAGGGSQMARFYSQRPARVEAATNNALDTIAPQGAAPSTLGPQAAEAATNELDQVRRNINTATRPAYQAAENHVLAPADFDPIAQSPAFQASLRRLRNDEVLGPEYAHQPDNSVAVVDAVTKDMRDRGVALGNATNPGFSSQTAARYTQGSAEARDIARDPARGGVQAYDDALTAQEQARRQNLNPLEQGPLGTVAAATDTRGAANAVLPPKPLTGGANELVDAITRIEHQAPGLGASLVRQRLADQFDSSAGRLVGGENQYGGARFAKDIAGTPQALTNLDAVTDALRVGPWQPGGPPPSDLQNLVEVLRATGQRKPQGSATAFNQQISHELSAPPISAEIAAAAKSGGLTIPTGVRDRAQRAWLGRGTSTLADLFLAPDSVDQMHSISQRAAQTPMTDAMLRQAFESPNEVNRGR